MPKVDNVGYGKSTPQKLEHLAKIIEMHVVITKTVLRRNSYFRQRYRYMDLTAGKGIVPNGLEGSPLLFIETIERLGLPYRADFVEFEDKNLDELKSTMQAKAKKNGWKPTAYYHSGCYEDIVPTLLKLKDNNELGLVFVDPSGDLPDVSTLKLIGECRPRMEILMYLSSTNVKRLAPYQNLHLSDFIKEINKKHWLIRKPSSDAHKWTFLLGSDSNLFKDYKKIGFFRLESEDAQGFFSELNLTTKERQERVQPRLPLEM